MKRLLFSLSPFFLFLQNMNNEFILLTVPIISQHWVTQRVTGCLVLFNFNYSVLKIIGAQLKWMFKRKSNVAVRSTSLGSQLSLKKDMCSVLLYFVFSFCSTYHKRVEVHDWHKKYPDRYLGRKRLKTPDEDWNMQNLNVHNWKLYIENNRAGS